MGQENEPATKRDLNRLEAKINDVEERLSAKIAANGAKIDANATKIDANTAKIEENGRKIDANRQTIEKVVQQVVENGARLDHMVTRDEFNKRFDELVTGIDGVMATLRRWEQEGTATNARLDRVEVDVDKNKRDIKEIKTKLVMP